MNTFTDKLLQELDDVFLLYVEDDAFVRESTLELLSMYFPHVDVAADGDEGLRVYQDFQNQKKRPYDIVLTDINMPKRNGLEMSHDIQAINPDQVIIVFSAHSETGYLLELIQMEIAYFIPKPITTPPAIFCSRLLCAIILPKEIVLCPEPALPFLSPATSTTSSPMSPWRR